MEMTTYLTSTSGLLCLSTTCDGKLRIDTAAFKVCFTASKYGFNALTVAYEDRKKYGVVSVIW